MKSTIERDIVLEYVNTQLGHLNATVRLCNEPETRGRLEQLQRSLANLKTGLERDDWSPEII